MKRIEYTSALLREEYTYVEHASGLPIYVFPKKMTNTYALFATKYGSMNTHFRVGEKRVAAPEGIAHFLEHKLFEAPDGTDTFTRFSALGADSNAYTDYDKTAYLFSCTEHVEEALAELLTFVTEPHFTAESVERERGIIGEEIHEDEDSPWERAYLNLVKALYHNNPVRNNVLGTVKTIAKITPELLYECYNAFYRLDNMALVVCGNVTPEQVLAVADRILPAVREEKETVTRLFPAEPKSVRRARVNARMQVAKPIFYIGIKDNGRFESPEEKLRHDLSVALLNEILFSQAGPFYSQLFEDGLVSPSFSFGYSCDNDQFAFTCLSGESKAPEAVYDALMDYLEGVKKNGLSDEDFERCRRVMYADEIRAYDSTDEIANRLLSFVFDGSQIFDVPTVLQTITKKELEELLHTLYTPTNFAMSVVRPL
jgi:predicted Zn-dependent peptidase